VRALSRFGSAFMPGGMRGKQRLRDISQGLAARYVPASRFFPANSQHEMYHHDYFAHVRTYDPYARHMDEFRGTSRLDAMSQMQYVDVRTYLSDDILVKVDKASMLNSLETRAPLLDQDLVEYVSSLPSTLRTRDGVLKYLLKRAGAGMLPTGIVTRSKQGFGVPIKHWLRGELGDLAQDLLNSTRARQRGIFNPRFVQGLLQAHASAKHVNYSQAIWALLCLELWFQVYMDEPPLAVEQRLPAVIASRK
jgi:asparagine synthase (glutamine-hydrolysing)